MKLYKFEREIMAKKKLAPSEKILDVPAKKKFKVGDIEATVKVDWGKKGPKKNIKPPGKVARIFPEDLQKEKQPGLFDGIDDVITALQLEENDLTDTLKKLKDARDKADERIKALEGRVDVLSAARKKAEKWIEKKK